MVRRKWSISTSTPRTRSGLSSTHRWSEWPYWKRETTTIFHFFFSLHLTGQIPTSIQVCLKVIPMSPSHSTSRETHHHTGAENWTQLDAFFSNLRHFSSEPPSSCPAWSRCSLLSPLSFFLQMLEKSFWSTLHVLSVKLEKCFKPHEIFMLQFVFCIYSISKMFFLQCPTTFLLLCCFTGLCELNS